MTVCHLTIFRIFGNLFGDVSSVSPREKHDLNISPGATCKKNMLRPSRRGDHEVISKWVGTQERTIVANLTHRHLLVVTYGPARHGQVTSEKKNASHMVNFSKSPKQEKFNSYFLNVLFAIQHPFNIHSTNGSMTVNPDLVTGHPQSNSPVCQASQRTLASLQSRGRIGSPR